MSSLRRILRTDSCARAARRAYCTAILLVCFAPGGWPQAASQQRVYGAGSATTTTSILPGYNKDSTTGALTLLPGSPFADRLEGGLVAIDGQGKFLFVLNPVGDDISMFQIDGSTGALTEVPASPFKAPPTINPNQAPSLPISLAAEKSGSFLYVGYADGDSSTTSALVPFSIDAANLRLVLTPQQSLDFGNGAPVQLLADPKGLHLYVGLGPGGNQGSSSAGTLVFSINASNGELTQVGSAGGGTDSGRSIAIDPQARFFYDGWGQTEGFLDSGVISPVDGTSNVSSTLSLGQGIFPTVLLAESSGKFLYVQTGTGLLTYSINGTSGALTLVSGPLAQFSLAKGTAVADPVGPYIYSLGRSGVDVFQIDPQSGNLTEIPGAPFSTGSSTATGSLGLAISGSPVQAVSGPAAQLFPAATDLGQVTVGQSSATKIVSIASTGDQTLAINGISIGGANAGDFTQSNTCGATLAANASCSISVVFKPSVAGPEQASLQVTDNAPGSPQSAALTGIGVAAQASVTIAPASVNFGTIQPGAIAPPQMVTITNSGTAPLHVSGITTSGANPGDFSQANTCVGAAVAIQASCTVTVSFTPQASGQRTASLVLADDAANSPQSVALAGTSVAGQGSAAISPASLNFGAMAQGATAPTQTITITNTGTSALHVGGIALSGANAGDFSQTNNCVGGAIAIQASCTATVGFTPQAVGQRTASLMITDDAGSSPQSVALSGSGAAAFQLSASGPASATVTAGQSAQYTIQVTPGPGFRGNVGFSCGGAPQAATCSVSPASLAISSANTATAQVNVTTTGGVLALPRRIDAPRRWVWRVALLYALALSALLWWVMRGMRGRHALARIGYAVLAGGALWFGAAGCGGGGGGGAIVPAPQPQPHTVTPKGVTMLTVTAQSGTLPQQTIQLTLTVN